MAKVDNLLLKGMSGSIGKSIVLRKRKDETFSGKYPDMSSVKPSKNQTKKRKFFAGAVIFAQEVLKDPGKKARYETMGEFSAYHAAIKQYMSSSQPEKQVPDTIPDQAKTAVGDHTLSESQLRAVYYVLEHKRLTNRLYCKLNGVSKPTATRHLRELADLQFILFNGKTGAGGYYMIGPGLE